MRASCMKLLLAIPLAFSLSTARAETGVTANTVLVGQTVGLTGTVAGPVKETNEGAQAYLSHINKRGGVHGRKIELKTLDDKFDPALARANAETLVGKDGVFMMFQGRGTPHTLEVMKVLEANNVPLLGPSTGATVFHQPVKKLLFNVRAKYQDEVARGIQHFATIGIRSIALLHVDDSFGQDGLEGFNKAVEKHGLTPAAIVKFARVDPDYRAAAAEVSKSNPMAVIIISSAKNTVEAIKALRALGSKAQIMVTSNNSSDAFVKDLGAAGAGVIISQITPAPLLNTVLGQEFSALAKEHKLTPSYAAMEGFVNAKVLVEGLRRAGPGLTREGFLRALESMQRVELGGILVTYGPNDHGGSDFVELTMIGRDGQFIR